MARVLHCTDFHGRKEWFRWLAEASKNYDAVVLSGDLIDEFAPPPARPAQVARVRKFLEEFTHPLLVVSGNHDGALDLAEIAARNPHLRVDGHKGVQFGCRILCTGWRGTPTHHTGPTELPVLLVVHQPPDDCEASRDARGDWGGHDVRAFAMTLPRGSLVLCGHVHSPLRWHTKVGPATVINPGVAPTSTPVPHHVIIDLAARRARFFRASGAGGEVVSF
jgi:Icc-related predicted phosphoesterase